MIYQVINININKTNIINLINLSYWQRSNDVNGKLYLKITTFYHAGDHPTRNGISHFNDLLCRRTKGFIFLQQLNAKKSEKMAKVAQPGQVDFISFWMIWWISIKFSGKIHPQFWKNQGRVKLLRLLTTLRN